MNIINEAGYLYDYSKKLIKINKELNKLSRKAHKHSHQHQKAKEEKKHKHQKRHQSTVNEIKELMKKHNQIITKLRHHHLTYAHALKKEHKT